MHSHRGQRELRPGVLPLWGPGSSVVFRDFFLDRMFGRRLLITTTVVFVATLPFSIDFQILVL